MPNPSEKNTATKLIIDTGVNIQSSKGLLAIVSHNSTGECSLIAGQFVTDGIDGQFYVILDNASTPYGGTYSVQARITFIDNSIFFGEVDTFELDKTLGGNCNGL